MQIEPSDFLLFNQREFSFKKLKIALPESEIEVIKTEYKTHWQKWKELQLTAYDLVAKQTDLAKPKVESWTNGWNLRNHFWSAYRGESRQKEATCLAVLLNKKQFQIYLMYQHYKSDEQFRTKQAYNQLVLKLADWAKGKDISRYYIWDNAEPELTDHLPLTDFLADPAHQRTFLTHLAKTESTFQLGAMFFAPDEVADAEEQIRFYLVELFELYQQLATI